MRLRHQPRTALQDLGHREKHPRRALQRAYRAYKGIVEPETRCCLEMVGCEAECYPGRYRLYGIVSNIVGLAADHHPAPPPPQDLNLTAPPTPSSQV